MRVYLWKVVALLAVVYLSAPTLAGTITLWDFNASTLTPSVGAGTLSTVGGTATNFETDPTKVDPNDPGGASLELSTWPAQAAPSGTAGIRFNVSTAGHTNIKVKWDIRHNLKNGETCPNTEKLQYTTNGGATWQDGPTWTDPGDQWMFNREVDLSAAPGVANNSQFGFRLMGVWQPGAGQYMPCPGSVYGATRKWRLDLIKVHDDPAPAAVNTVALWDFDDQRDFIADYGDGISSCDLIGGIALDGDGYSKDYPTDSEPWDVTASSDPSLKGKGLDTVMYPAQGAGNDTAGVQFNVSTVGYSGIKISFDLKHKKQSSRYIRLQYTTNRTASPVVWVSADPLFSHVIPDASQDAWWFNNNVVDLVSVSAVNNNPSFAFRMVTEFDPTNPGRYSACLPSETYGQDEYYNKLRYDMVRVTAASALPSFPVNTILATKQLAQWQRIALTDTVVTAAHPDYFWVETTDRTMGLKIYAPQHNMSDGWKVNVTGITRVGRDTEKYAYANFVDRGGTDTTFIDPLGLQSKSIGGADWCWNPTTGTGQKGISSGCMNTGLLVRIAGRVTAAVYEDGSTTDLTYLYVDDGSGLYDGNLLGPDGGPANGIRIVLPKNFTGDYLGKFVAVTGVSSIDRLDSVSDMVCRAIRRPTVDTISEP